MSKKEPLTFSEEVIINKVTNLGAKAKLLEERYNILRKKVELIEENLVSLEREYQKSLRILEEDILEIKRAIEELKERLIAVAMDIEKSATLEEMQEVRAYVNLLDPSKWKIKEEK